MIVSLSILNIDKKDREPKIKDFMQIKDNWIHFDVMDGEFVENKTFCYDVVKEVNEYCSFFKDVHLMTYNPKEYLTEYKKAGTDQITFHYESVDEQEILQIISEIKALKMKVGISVKPSTNIKCIEKYLPYLENLLNNGGVIFADNVLYRGMVESTEFIPHKKRTIVVCSIMEQTFLSLLIKPLINI